MPEDLELIENLEQTGTGVVQEQPTAPASWGDLFLYLSGCLGGYFLLSLGVLAFFQELNLTVTVLTALLNFLCFAGGVYLFAVRRGKLSWKRIGLLPARRFWFSVLTGGALAVAVNMFRFVVMFLIIIVLGTELESLAGREEFFLIGLDSWQGILLSLIGIGVLVPIAEELFFRGLLYDWFRQKTPIWAAVMITSLLFGLAHYDSWIVMISTFIMGIALALAYEYSKSIWVSIFMHIFTNAGSVLLMVFVVKLEELLFG
jgi:membrane protease YdiL (CAAX protease family)